MEFVDPNRIAAGDVDRALDSEVQGAGRRLRRVESIRKASVENGRDCLLGQPEAAPAAEQARWVAVTL